MKCSEIYKTLEQALPVNYEIRYVSCMAGCSRPTTVGFQGKNKAQYLFGDIKSAKDIIALVDFAYHYQHNPDGWTNSKERPKQLAKKTISRMPHFNT